MTVASIAVGARLLGSFVALGYLLGIAEGSLFDLVGALAAICFGRVLSAREGEDVVPAAALAVVAVAIGAGAMRWATADLDALRGAQAVLGPTVLVAPPELALSSLSAAIAGLAAATAWAATPDLVTARPAARALGIVELVVIVAAVATVYWGPAWAGRGTGTALGLDTLRWGLTIAVPAGLAASLSSLVRSVEARLWVVGTAGLVAVAASTATWGLI